MPDLIASNIFSLQTDQVTMARFRKCSGLKDTTEVIESHEVTEDGTIVTRLFAGKTKNEPLTFEASLADSQPLQEWRQQVRDGDIEKARRNGSIVQYDSMKQEVARWNFVNGWPSDWAASDFDASANSVATQTVTIQHEGITRA